jgi:hypothetical protein
VKGIRSLDDLFIFMESENRLTMDSEEVTFLYIISKARRRDKPNHGEWRLFKNVVPQAPKRGKLTPENTLLVNQIS